MQAMRNTWLVWQLADSAFPTGGFAHSAGLEAAWQNGEVPDLPALRRFLHESIRQAGRAALPLVTAAHLAPSRLEALDALAEAFLTSAVANRASRVQGRALVATCARIWPEPALIALEARAHGLCAHYAPLAGAVWRTLEIPLDVAQRLFLFQTARGLAAAAVRLGIVGSYEAQRLQADCGAVLEAVVARCATLDDGDITQTAPILDILQSTHDRLYSRLFQS
jgi:urease accessory protein